MVTCKNAKRKTFAQYFCKLCNHIQNKSAYHCEHIMKISCFYPQNAKFFCFWHLSKWTTVSIKLNSSVRMWCVWCVQKWRSGRRSDSAYNLPSFSGVEHRGWQRSNQGHYDAAGRVVRLAHSHHTVCGVWLHLRCRWRGPSSGWYSDAVQSSGVSANVHEPRGEFLPVLYDWAPVPPRVGRYAGGLQVLDRRRGGWSLVPTTVDDCRKWRRPCSDDGSRKPAHVNTTQIMMLRVTDIWWIISILIVIS